MTTTDTTRGGAAGRLAHAVAAERQAKAEKLAAMKAMRADGASLQAIADVAGMTPRGVQQALGGKGH